MKLITVLWREAGYSCSFYATELATVPDAIDKARSLVSAARTNAPKRIFGLRVKISLYPTKS